MSKSGHDRRPATILRLVMEACAGRGVKVGRAVDRGGTRERTLSFSAGLRQ